MQVLLQKPRLIVDPVAWASEIRSLKGQPFSFKDRDYLYPMYREQCKKVIVVKARQLEITEYAVNLALYWATTRPHTTVLYVAPRADQTARISKDRFNPAITYAKHELKKEFEEVAVERKSLKNGSVIYFVSGWGAGDAARGIPADVLIIDEVQDMAAEAIATIQECLSHSELKMMYLIGSPKLAGSEFEKLWKLSDQKEWDPNTHLWQSRRREEEQGPIYYSGYHMSQEWVPWISKDDIEAKRIQLPEQQFVNEVLGKFYAGGRVKLTIEQVMACTKKDLDFEYARIQAPRWTVMGIDWGVPSYYIILDPRALSIVHMGTFDDKSLDFISEKMERFNVSTLVADVGYGDTEIRNLQAKYGPRVVGSLYQWGKDYVFKREYVQTKDKKDMKNRPILIADRTKCLDETYELFYSRKLKIPYHKNVWEKVEPAFDHFMALFEDHKEATATTSAKKVYERMGPDHFFHALTYANMAVLYENGLNNGTGGMMMSSNPIASPVKDHRPIHEENELDLEEFRGDDRELADWRRHNWD